MFCKNCGEELDEGSKFCNCCGASQGVITSNSNEYESIKRSETARKVGEVIGALGTTAIIQGAIDKHMDKEKEKTKQLISKAEQAEKNVENYMKERWG